MKHFSLLVSGMTCNHWTAAVDKALRGVDGARKLSVTLKPRGAKIDTIDQVAIAAESGADIGM
jgi:copper chaperone CopZ